MKNNPIKFGTILIDKNHIFFGKSDPTACIIASAWFNENEAEADDKVYIDHFRAHFEVSLDKLRDTDRFEVLGVADTTKDVHKQLQDAELKWQSEHEDYMVERNAANDRALKLRRDKKN